MNAAQSPRRPITAVVLQSLMWLWLIGLSVFVALGYQAVNEQVDQELLNSRLQRLEAQAVGLAEAIEAIQQRPTVATAADLKDTRELLEARAAQVEDAPFTGARLTTIDGLRADWNDGWGLLRASNTTPVLVLRFEADNETALRRIKDLYREQLRLLLPDAPLDF